MDALINSASELSRVLLPILGAIVLIVLIMILIKVLKIVTGMAGLFGSVDKLITDVDKTIDKVQEPVDTVVKLFKTIDTVHDAGVNAAGQVKDFVAENVETIKTKINSFKKEESLKEDRVQNEGAEVVYEENNNL